jgi:hypothetical protein
VFDEKGRKAGEWEINLGETDIRSVQAVKFLGLHTATNLNWEKQIESISKKCENPLKILNCIKITWWGRNR